MGERETERDRGREREVEVEKERLHELFQHRGLMNGFDIQNCKSTLGQGFIFTHFLK